MSASRERKKRSALEQMPAAASAKKEKKKISEGVIFAVTIIAILALVLGGLFGYRAWQQNQTVLTVGENKVSVKEFNYFFNTAATTYFENASYFGMDTSTPLDETKIKEEDLNYLGLLMDTSYLDNYEAVDGVYDVTMAQLVANSAKEIAVEAYTIYDAAMEAGFEMDEHIHEEIDAQIEDMKNYGKMNFGWSLSDTISNVYGNGCNERNFRDYLEVVTVAQHYPSTVTYEDAEISARYDESPETFDVVSYYLYNSSAHDFVTADENGETPEPTEAEEAKAKEAAEAMEKNFKIEDENVVVCNDYTLDRVTSNCGEEAAKWVFETAKEGDVKSFLVDDTYYVMKLAARDVNYETASLLQIYIPDDAADAELAEDQPTAEKKLEMINAALAEDGSAENFAALAAEYNQEGVEAEVTDVSHGTISSISKEAFIWTFMEDRQAGDWTQLSINGGTILLMYTGNSRSYRDISVSNTMITEWIEADKTAALETCEYNEKSAMSANVGLSYSTGEQ